jgi:hypothetical protein
MQRRTLLQLIGSATVAVPFSRVRLWAQPRELSADAVATLRDIAPTVLPASIGADRVQGAVDRFVVWTRGYREGVPLAHGYGHPRLQKSGASPVAGYLAQLTAIEADARAHGGRFSTLDLDARRALLDASIAKAGVRNLPQRPTGQHVVVDLMALYFRSSEANDDCYRALIQREVCRPIQITTRRPDPKG